MKLHLPFAESVRLGKTCLARFMPGDNLFEVLKNRLRELGIERACILSAVGSLKNAVFRNPKSGIDLPVESEKTNEILEAGPAELLSLQGNVMPLEGELAVHLHVLLGRPDGTTVGGHLFEATVFSTVEILFAEIAESSVYREYSEVTGLKELKRD